MSREAARKKNVVFLPRLEFAVREKKKNQPLSLGPG